MTFIKSSMGRLCVCLSWLCQYIGHPANSFIFKPSRFDWFNRSIFFLKQNDDGNKKENSPTVKIHRAGIYGFDYFSFVCNFQLDGMRECVHPHTHTHIHTFRKISEIYVLMNRDLMVIIIAIYKMMQLPLRVDCCDFVVCLSCFSILTWSPDLFYHSQFQRLRILNHCAHDTRRRKYI